MNRTLRAFAVVALAAAAPLAAAHAFLDRASPRVGSTVRASPAQVTLRFNENLEAAFSTVRVADEDGREVDRHDNRLDPSDHSILRVSLPPLAPGKYRVQWRVLSVDTHVTAGEYTFTLVP